jgi:excisionase family DNA binding protein
MSASEPIECGTYSVPQAGKKLGLSDKSVIKMITTGRLPHVDTGTRNYVIPRWAVDRLVAPPETVTVTLVNEDLVQAAMREAS